MSDDMSSDEESMGSLKDFIVEDSESDVEEEPVVKKQKVEEPIALLETEASQFVGQIEGSTVNGRTLRSREKLTKPKDLYYERFGAKAEAEILEKFTKKDIIEFVKDLESEHKAGYEASGKTWPKLNTKMSLESIREHYDDIKAFAGLPDSDDETGSDEEPDSSAEDESEDESEEEDSDEESEDDESEEDSESDDESDEESSEADE